MPATPPIGESAAPVTAEALDVRVTVDLDDFYNRLLNETRTLLTDLSQRNLSTEDLAAQMEAGLEDLGDSMINQMGRGATSEAFNLGRNMAAQELSDLIGMAVRTEVLDRNTCDPCDELDGTVVPLNSPEYFAAMPPNGCDGGDFCRGFYLYRLA